MGNVDYGGTPEELQGHFRACGSISRITVMVDKFTCQPKGFAYIEFESEESVKSAVLLNDSLFRGIYIMKSESLTFMWFIFNSVV